MPGVTYVIYGCFSARTTLGVSLLLLYRSWTQEENIVAVINQYKVIDDNLKRQIKLLLNFNILAICLPTLFAQYIAS